MIIENYYDIEKNEQFAKQLKSWLNDWHIDFKIIDLLPTTGWFISNCACIFLVETNSKVCYVEGLVSNPNLDKSITNEAMNMLVSNILTYAKERGYQLISSNSKYIEVANRAKRFGFNIDDNIYIHFSKEL